MLLSSKNKILILFCFCYLFIKVKLTNYISFELIKADDCVRLVNISNQILFKFIPKYDGICNNLSNLGHCDAGNDTMYPQDKFLIKNYEYEEKIEIEITFEDWNHIDGFMDMNVYFNEYKIKTSDQVFWKCINCGNGNQDYFYENNRMNFYSGTGPGGCSEKLYKFIFKIDDINEIYQGGKNGPFEIMSDFYAFTDQQIFEREVYNSEGDLELQLINFNVAEILHFKSNESIPLDINNYFFRVEFSNIGGGHLKGLGLDDVEKELYSWSSFKVNDTSGLNFILSPQQKEQKYAEVNLKITVLNNCLDEYNCKIVVPAKDFTFKIKVVEFPDTTIPLTEKTERPSDSTEQTERPSDTTEQTERSSYTTE